MEASAPQDVGSLLPVDDQTMDIPLPRDWEETGDVSVQLATDAINDCMQSLKLNEEKVAKLEEVSSSLRSRLQVLTKSSGSRHAVRQAQNDLDLLIAQLREAQQFVHDKKQLLAELFREATSLEHEAQTARCLTRCSGAEVWTVYEMATARPGAGYQYRVDEGAYYESILPNACESMSSYLLCRQPDTKTCSAGSRIHMFTTANSGTGPWV